MMKYCRFIGGLDHATGTKASDIDNEKRARNPGRWLGCGHLNVCMYHTGTYICICSNYATGPEAVFGYLNFRTRTLARQNSTYNTEHEAVGHFPLAKTTAILYAHRAPYAISLQLNMSRGTSTAVGYSVWYAVPDCDGAKVAPAYVRTRWVAVKSPPKELEFATHAKCAVTCGKRCPHLLAAYYCQESLQ